MTVLGSSVEVPQRQEGTGLTGGRGEGTAREVTEKGVGPHPRNQEGGAVCRPRAAEPSNRMGSGGRSSALKGPVLGCGGGQCISQEPRE